MASKIVVVNWLNEVEGDGDIGVMSCWLVTLNPNYFPFEFVSLFATPYLKKGKYTYN